MKKFFIYVLGLIFFNSIAQTTNPLDQQLINVDQSTVTSGIIYERSQRTTNLVGFNQPGGWHNIANFNFFKQVLGELHYASNKTRLISVDELKTRNQNTPNHNEVNIGIINSSVHVMNYDAINQSNGGLTFDGNYFYEIRRRVPFYRIQTTAISPLKKVVSGSNIIYKFANNLFLNNGDISISRLTANFGDGIIRTIIENGTLVANTITINNNLSNETQKIIFQITYSNNIIVTTHGEIFISKDVSAGFSNAIQSNATPCDLDPNVEDIYSLSNRIVADEGFQGINETTATKGQLEVKAFYNVGHQKIIRKPILIIDGFDPQDVRKVTDCDCENDPTGNCQDKNQNKDTKKYDAKEHKSIVELMAYKDESGGTENLISVLRSKGYDVLIVNQPTYTSAGKEIDGGADFIERNGLALVKLIKDINQRLQQVGSAEKLVVVGPSMGGQISRYALAYMEKKYAETNVATWKHNTRLWIAFDSPNLGANVPLGDQALINILRDGGANEGAQDSYMKGINSTASKQLLIELHQQPGILNEVNNDYLNASTISQGMQANRGNPYFQNHYNNQFANGLPNSNGYPMNLRKIALTNGSLTGKRPLGTDRALMLDARLITQYCYRPFNLFGWRPSICYTTKLATVQASLMPEVGGNTEIASLKKLSLGGEYTRATNNNSRGNLDLVPGGLIDATGIIFDELNGKGPSTRGSFWQFPMDNMIYWYTNSWGEGAQWEEYALIRNQCFIPTFSALGMKNPNQNWASPLNRNLVCSNETIFDSYYGEAENTEHIFLNQNSVNWLLKELGSSTEPPIPQAPSFPIDDISISGISSICTNDNIIFSLPDLCKLPSGAVWTVTGPLAVVFNNQNTITVSRNGNGAATITATFQNGQKIVKNIWVGVPLFNRLDEIGNQNGFNPNEPNISYGETNEGCNQIRLNAVFDSNTIQSYQWEKLSTAQVTIPPSSTTGYLSLMPQCNDTVTFRVRAQNACGWSDWQTVDYEMTRCTKSCSSTLTTNPTTLIGDNFVLNPNPVTNGILQASPKNGSPWFSVPAPNGLTTADGEPAMVLMNNIVVNISILNQTGVQVLSYNNFPIPGQLDLTSLAQGTYLVILEYQGLIESYTIIKN